MHSLPAPLRLAASFTFHTPGAIDRSAPPCPPCLLTRPQPRPAPSAADGVPALSGFNGDDLTRLLFSDLLDDPGRVLWVGALAVAGLVAAVTFEAETMGSPEQLRSPAEQQRWERKRGVTWLALATLAAIWCTGVVNRPAPFQP